ncbi:MAG: hypothetical protein H0T73_20700 [Ardenticatenales bacterium]|nr:hypothetical protein [Ardenticatenales bacterium]
MAAGALPSTWKARCQPHTPLLQRAGNPLELFQRGLQILHDLPRQHIGIGEVGRVLQRLVAQPEEVEVDLVSGYELVIAVAPPASVGRGLAPGGAALVALPGLVARNELIEVGAAQRVLLQGEVLVVRR